LIGLDGPAVAIDIQVRFAETDAMGIVHHGNYLVWFEAGRVAWMDAAGMPYAELAAGGNHFAVIAVQVEYRTPARFGDTVRILSRLTELRSRRVGFAYEVVRVADGSLLATGASSHICVDLEGRMARVPEHAMARLQAGLNQLAGTI
jgi:acyl-CoA thioester hydrolase